MADTNVPGSGPAGGGGGLGPLARLMLWLGIISLAFVVFVIVAPINSWFPEATKQAAETDGLFKFMLATSGVIFIYVQGMVLVFALRYRRRKEDAPDALGPVVHGNTRLEFAWTAAPSLLLVILAILSMRVFIDEHAQQPKELDLNVRGYQFGFAYSLPQYGIKDKANVVIPVNRPVYLAETSSDVIHAFWVPAFRTQEDMVPGIVTNQRFTPVETGTFPVICTQFCGSGHSGMHTTITVGTEAQFEAYLRRNGATKLPSNGSTAELVPHQ